MSCEVGGVIIGFKVIFIFNNRIFIYLRINVSRYSQIKIET